MSNRAASRLAWATLALVVALYVADFLLWAFVTPTGRPFDPYGFFLLPFPAVGFVLASRQPRNATDLDSLRAELLGLVAQTMQPASVSLWLRVPE
jgi:hypothetical protein